MSSCDSEFRFPIPKDLGPGLSTCNIIIKAPNKIDDEKLNIISQRLSEKSSNLFKKETDQNPDKKSFKDKEFDKYGKLVIFPTNFKSNDCSSWAALRPIDPRYKRSYVSIGIGQTELTAQTAEKEFVEKTKNLLLNDGVKKSVEESAPGDKVLEIAPKVSSKKLKKLKKEEREKTKGKEWFDMAAPELTPELQNELDILKMRSAIDPTRFYKKSDATTQSKYFQIGHVIDAPADFYSDRVSKKDRKRTLVDELMADAEFKKYSKKKYVEIIAEKSKTQKKHFKRKFDKKKGKGQTSQTKS